MTNDAIRFFLSRFGLTVAQIEDLLATALARGGDYADLYFEYRENNSVSARRAHH
jgi:TldD protein